MKQKPGIVLKELGSKLKNLPTSKHTLIHILEQAATVLSECDQSPAKSVLTSMQPFMNAVVISELLKHQDGDVKLLVATCICEIMRITAPEAPYGDDVLKDIFHLIVSTFSGLSDTSEPSFGRRAVILKTLADFRSCVVMLDLECDDLIKEMFSTILAVASDGHPESVLNSMQTIMAVLLEESEEIQEDLLLILLSDLGRNKKDITTAGRRLAMNVIKQCSEKLELGIKKFLISSMSDDNRSLNCQIDYHEVIYDIYRCAPQVLSEVVPYLTGELLTDKIDIRLKAVRLVGDLLALPESAIPETFQPIFSEFLKRLTDRVVEVRMAVLETVKRCLMSSPSKAEAPQIISALFDRLLDYDENVRKQVVAVLCDVACCSPTSVPVETTKLVAERLTDKSLLVKKYTMERLAEIYSKYCLECSNRESDDEYDWIPGMILRCFYDKDIRSDAVEPILCSLFPNEFSVKDKVRKWVRVFPRFDRIEIKALEKILEQKQRLQQEMLRYLSLRQMHQENDGPEYRKKAMTCFHIMSRSFIDPGKAEENFLILDQLKDADVWKILTTLLDPNTTCLQACCSRDDALKILGEKHRLYEFLRALSMKCSYLLFNKEHVKEILQEADMQKSTGSAEFTLSCMNILVILACSIPLVLSGIEEDFVHLLEDDNEIIKEGVLHVLAKAGGTIRDQLRISSSSLDLILERICLEGSRRQAKYAVHALAAVTKDEGLMSLSVLYKRLLDMLEERKNLPAVLQSLGCIAEIAMSVFETRESEIETFIKREILDQKHIVEGKATESWDERSKLCSLKIFACKTLVKSYLPVRDAHLRLGIDDLMTILKSILSFGEISKDIESSSVDKAHMKLAGAKSILRLSRYWDQKIPIDLFYLTLRTSEVDFPQVERLFLRKVHQYIKDRLLDPKYACAFLFNLEPEKPDFEEDKHNLYEIIQTCQQVKARHSVSDAASSVAYPESILPYLVHAIAHHSSCPNIDECKDVKSFEPIYRRLYMFLSMLMHADENDKSEDNIAKEKQIISMIISIFQSIKLSEDSVDATKSKNSHGICDLGLSIIKRLAKQDIQQDLSGSTSLPSMLYKKYESKGGDPLVNKGKTWLADDGVVSHFESLNLEANETVLAKIAEDEDIKDSDTDENEVPLGKMIKRLRAKSMNARKITKNGPSLSLSQTKNDIDILKLVREMDLDTVGNLEKLEPSGHEHVPEKSEDKIHKQSKRKTGELANFPVPKRQRSSSAQAHRIQSLPRGGSSTGVARPLADSFSQGGESTFESIKKDDKLQNDLKEKNSRENPNVAESDFLASSIRKRSDFSSKAKGRGSANNHKEIHKVEESDDHDLDTPTIHMDTDGLFAGSARESRSVKKRKRRSVAGLAKCTSKEGEHTTTDLVDCRVKIWWPMDKQFYEGVVKSYDQDNNKHVIKYDDGDIEVLCLDKERWELLEKDRKTTKRVNISKSGPAKGLSSTEQRKKSSGGSRESKQPIKISPSSKVRGKRTPRKNLRHSQKRVSKSISAEFGKDSRHSPGGLDNEPVTTLKAEESETDEHSNKMEENFGADEDRFKHEISVSKEHHLDAESDSSDTKNSKEEGPDSEAKDNNAAGTSNTASGSHENHAEETQEASVSREGGSEIASEMQKSNSQGIQADDADSYEMGSDESARIHSATNASEEAEDSENEPLGAWKSRVGKSVARK